MYSTVSANRTNQKLKTELDRQQRHPDVGVGVESIQSKLTHTGGMRNSKESKCLFLSCLVSMSLSFIFILDDSSF